MLEVLVDDSCEPTPPRDVDLVVLEEKLEDNYSDDVDETICDLSWRFSPRDAWLRGGLVLSMSIWRSAILRLIKSSFVKVLTAGS